MEFHSMSKMFHPHHLGEEKQQMLNLNRRLETYLNRVKLLEEENALLAKEIQAARHNGQGALTHRKGLEEELRQARLEVDAAWRDRVLTEVEVRKLAEELQALNLQRQREAQAQMVAKKKLEQSRKELEEEQRAQIWLREKVSQLEHEMRHLIQTHGEDVAHLETVLTQSRAAVPPTLAQRGSQTPDVLKVGHELSQKATRAWQEAAEAYQGQLSRVEESLDQARSRLNQVCQEKLESKLTIKALEKEIASAQDVRLHLEKTAAQKKDKHWLEVQQLQEHLENLEVEKGELGQQISELLQENRSLVQLKMSLGLEVATYRALLDGESLRGDTSVLNKPRNVLNADALFGPHGVTKNYQAQLAAGRKTTFPSSVRGVAGPAVITTTPFRTRKPATLNERPTISSKHADAAESAQLESPYPKIIQDGVVENFRPQEVHEKVTYAEPLSPPNEQEIPAETPEDNGADDWTIVDAEAPEERPVVESVVSHEVKSGLSRELSFSDEAEIHQFTASSLTSHSVSMIEEPFNSSVQFSELDKNVADAVSHETLHLEDKPVQEVREQEEAGKATAEDISSCVALEEAAEKGLRRPHPPADASVEVEYVEEDEEEEEEEYVEEDISDCDSQILLEPTLESMSGSRKSEPAEGVFSKDTGSDDAVEIKREPSSFKAEVNGVEVEKLYPDGEEMDTWDSVIEKKADVGTDDDSTNNEGKNKHAEPEEDISAKEPEFKKGDIVQDDHVEYSPMPTQVADGQITSLDQEQAPPPDGEEEEDDDQDSQNVSVSWRTELESDSYAQENTLADTRPLIRYKSDETDGNTQHMDESESSEGEQEKKTREAETGAWMDGKSKTFGTMEDLCEDVEEETIEDEYNLGYTQIEDRDISQSTIVSERGSAGNDTENAGEMVRNDSEGHSEEESEEHIRPRGHTNLDYDEELEIDRLVEQELENLSTDIYSAHHALQQVSNEMLHPEDESVQEVNEQEDAGEEAAEDVLFREPEKNVHDHAKSTTVADQASEKTLFSDLLAVMPPTDSVTEEVVQPGDQEEDENNMSMVTHAMDTTVIDQASEKPLFSDLLAVMPPTDTVTEEVVQPGDQEEDENMSMVTHAMDITVIDQASEKPLFSDLLAVMPPTGTVTEEVVQPGDQEEDENNMSMVTHATDITVTDQASEKPLFSDLLAVMPPTDTVTEEVVQPGDQEEDEDNMSMMTHAHVTDHCDFSDFISRTDMEETNRPEDPNSVSPDEKDIQDVAAPHEFPEAPPEETSSESPDYLPEHAEDFHEISEDEETVLENSTQESINLQELADEDAVTYHEKPAESAANESDIYIVQDLTDRVLHDLSPSGEKNDFWVSSLQSGATFEQDDTCNEAAKQTYKNQGFGVMWEDLENPKVVNGNSSVDDSSKALDDIKEREKMHSEMRKVFHNLVEGEMFHSEESEIEAGSWSSGE